jgi:hypothetical protein
LTSLRASPSLEPVSQFIEILFQGVILHYFDPIKSYQIDRFGVIFIEFLTKKI